MLVERFLDLAQQRTVNVPVHVQDSSHKPPRDRSFGEPQTGAEKGSPAKAPLHSRATHRPEAGAQPESKSYSLRCRSARARLQTRCFDPSSSQNIVPPAVLARFAVCSRFRPGNAI